MNAQFWINIFVRLGERLSDFGRDERSRAIIARAVARNPWFSEASISLAVSAIRNKMLDGKALAEWLADYSYDFSARRGRLGIIMAGNIPLVGFFDLMCGLICGYECHLHTSSKDSDTTGYLIDILRDEFDKIPIFDGLSAQDMDALIASGSDTTIAQIRTQYESVRTLLRGNRSSIAVLSGSETSVQLAGLKQDIFSHNGLGCRNVSHLFLPVGYPPDFLVEAFESARLVVEMWHNNYLSTRALLMINNEPFVDGGFFLLRPDEAFPMAISEITYQFYTDISEVKRWIELHGHELQCVVSEELGGSVPFGQAQFPALTDYPDRRDVIEFLCHA